ncbi:hypothetical protein DSL64_12565 [Dyadobacter luteus]|uniref:Peptidase M56 domain-containing protein n=1 Tax=Dyadobacter luteus TaxID=2259619 RepID=A0A3D8YC80_9BACT|nr:M56 family metallopeptidase [Dyadobacter luteus]REA61275.1 hypothetical protein DSL64_12565 [Dyadobacter luteus]
MSPYIEYLLKVSIGLMVMTVFYQIALRKFTFYNWNRWYLLGYSVLTFFIPFINVDSQLKGVNPVATKVVRMVPLVQDYTKQEIIADRELSAVSSFYLSDIVLFVIFAGGLLMLFRAGVAAYAFYKIKKKARLISNQGVKLYDVSKDIMPFSFGGSIFINRHLHDENDLKEIILHEYIHIRQKHTIDILWAELICVLNWYNPFAWMLRAAIRQNLEFIADRAVLENGTDAKAYQYLLLKVVGVREFRIASQFNFSSLKQRIMMMNKMKTARIHLIRFLFVLPLLCVLLVAFRNIENNFTKNKGGFPSGKIFIAGIVADAETGKPIAGMPLKVTSGFKMNKSMNIVSAGGEAFISSSFPPLEYITTIKSDENGFYWFEKDVRGDSSQVYRVTITDDEYKDMFLQVIVKNGEPRWGAFNVSFIADKNKKDLSGGIYRIDQKEFFAGNKVTGDVKLILKKELLEKQEMFWEECHLKNSFKQAYKKPKHNITKFGKGYFDQSRELVGWEGVTEFYLDGEKVPYNEVNSSVGKSSVTLLNTERDSEMRFRKKLFYYTYKTNLEAPPASYLKEKDIEWLDIDAFDITSMDSEAYFLDGFRQTYGVGSNLKPSKSEIKRIAVFRGKLARYYDKNREKILWIETRPVDEVYGRPAFAGR